MNRSYLLPILAFIPLAIIIITLVELEYDFTPLTIGLIIALYFAANVIYSVMKKTFHVSMLVELSLVALIAFFVLTSLLK